MEDELERKSSVKTITPRTPVQETASRKADQPRVPQVNLAPPKAAQHIDDARRVSRTVELTGATASGLMAQITSPSDYVSNFELLHDFFLTYRSYITQADLLAYMFTRLEWSMTADSDFARIVKVRVFVAIRHWLLNYFLEDFVLNRALRSQFCKLANSLCQGLRRSAAKDGDRNICREIKRCYCDQLRLYWDIPRTLDPDARVYYGGELGSRDPMLADEVLEKPAHSYAHTQLYNSPLAMKHITALPEHDTGERMRQTQNPSMSTAPEEVLALRRRHEYRNSDQSIDVTWCAMPRKALRNKLHHSKTPLGPRSATPEAMREYMGTPQPAPAPKTPLQSPRLPFQSDASSSTAPDIYASPSFLNATSPAPTALSLSGSLVRGMGVQPMSPQVVIPRDADITHSVAPSFVDPFTGNSTQHRPSKSSVSTGPSLLGSVRRALSVRKFSTNTLHGPSRSRNASKASGRGSATPTPYMSSPGMPGRPSGSMPRVDMLAAQLLQSFESAIRGQTEQNDTLQHTGSGNEAVVQTSRIAEVPPPITEVSEVSDERIEYGQALTQGEEPTHMGPPSIVEKEPELERVEEFPQELPQEKRSKHRHALSAESNFTDLSAGIRGSHHAPLNEALHKDIAKSSPTLTQDITTRFNDAPIVEESSEVETIVHGQPEALYLRNYNKFPYGLSPNSTQKSLGAETFVTDVTDTSTNDPFSLERINSRHIKRQPGGDLRAHEHVRSLMVPPQHHSMYLLEDDGSVSPSMSDIVETTGPGQANQRTSALGMLTTHSSQQLANMDPLFVQAAADLAALPDEADDGGIEATLAKLEGRITTPEYDELSQAARMNALDRLEQATSLSRPDSAQAQSEDLRRHREEEVDGVAITLPPDAHLEDAQESFNTMITQPRTHDLSSTRAASISDSMTSYSSTPILERGDSSRNQRHHYDREGAMVLPSDPLTAADESYVTAMENEMSDEQPVSEEGQSVVGSVIERPQYERHRRAIPSQSTQRSFLLDPDQSLSHLDATPPEEPRRAIARSEMRSFYDDADSVHEDDVLPHPLAHPKTPPRAIESIKLQPEPKSLADPRLAESVSRASLRRHVPLQDRVDYHARAATDLRAGSGGTIREMNTIYALPPRPLFSISTNHYPFVLAYEAAILAQQFTLIEKDALSDITWRELVDHRWSSIQDPHLNWADYLNSFNNSPEELYLRGGIDVCTTRFNLMVQWVSSEILLTQEVHERAACISKFIQIASECRKIRNWATAIQITMALTSSRVQRLTRTWSLMLDHDRQDLQSLDIMILPARNFSNIRNEQDRHRIKADRANEDKRLGRASPSGIGCVPWMALYTRDLVANAQKPEYLEAPMAVTADGVVLTDLPGAEDKIGTTHGAINERVINVERMRASASIIRHFVDLKRASEEYVLRSVPEILSRCLWIAALPEEELESRSRMIEH